MSVSSQWLTSSVTAEATLTEPSYSSSPELYPFDRLLPKIRDESLPLIVLYASATDEAFPTLFDFLHKLAQPANGHPRIQLALRWKLNRDDETTFRDRFDVNAHLESSTTFGSTEGELL